MTRGSDRRGPPQRGSLSQPGAGLRMGRMCSYCRESKPQAGAKVIGPLKRFKCADCVARSTLEGKACT